MKQCPACRTTYTDETLLYCLADGTPLEDTQEQATVVRPAVPAGQMRVEIPADTQNTNFPTQPGPPSMTATSSGGGGLKIALGLAVVLLLLVGLVVIAGLVYYYNSRSELMAANTANRAVSPAPLPSMSPAANDQDQLREQIANLARQLNEQKNGNRPANISLPAIPNPPSSTTARVNSPEDGFLALRTLPSSDVGDRIVKIPHGATISVGACGPVVRPVSRTGRWCQATYNGYSGWVFDAYLNY